MIKNNLDCVCVCLHFVLIMIDEALIDECMSMSLTFYCPDRNSQSPGSYFSLLAMYSCLENFIDGGTWWATVHGVAESDTIEQLTHTHTHNLPIIKNENSEILILIKFEFGINKPSLF